MVDFVERTKYSRQYSSTENESHLDWPGKKCKHLNLTFVIKPLRESKLNLIIFLMTNLVIDVR